MKNCEYFIISELHLVDRGGETVKEGDVIKITTCSFEYIGEVTNIRHNEITLNLDSSGIDGEVTIEYEVIDDIDVLNVAE